MHRTVVPPGVLKDRSAEFALHLSDLIYFRVSAVGTNTVHELVAVVLAVSLRFVAALLGAILLGILPEPLLTGSGGAVECFPQVLTLPH